jgi:2-polyprenyl-6-methoxyphenol hydroxylase-like FAD-dependent oxidoreductase
MDLRIGIIGCGIAGQAAGIALARDGHEVVVVERFAEAKPLGAGLLLQPSGLLALDRLGLPDAALQWGTPVARLFGKSVRGRTVMDLRYADIGEDVHGVGIHRAALFDVLHLALIATRAQIRLGFDVSRIEDLQSPRLIALDGRVEGPFDLVLDCAGAHDGLRETLGARVRAPLYPWGALWATCPDRAGAFGGELRQVYDRAHLMIGILPIGRAPGSAPQENSVSFFWSLRLEDFAAQRDAGLDALKSRVLAAWPEAAPILDEIKSFDALSLATYRDVRLRPAFKGRVLAIGDAAHGTSPQLGQGANLALIDAVVLAHALRREADIDPALSTYVKQRRAHLRFYQMASAALTPAFQSDSRVIAWARDIFLGPTGRLPGLRHIMRTTLAGTRKFPLGIYRLPEK